VPKLFKFEDETKTIWTEYCGISLNLKYPPKERYRFKPEIRKIAWQLEALGLYHNDIRWKNIVESDSGSLFLIDFECVSEDNRERDPEYILRNKI
jgi:thiamine kinase-like enzyme